MHIQLRLVKGSVEAKYSRDVIDFAARRQQFVESGFFAFRRYP